MPAEATLSEAYGPPFEQAVIWLLLNDREVAARLAGRLDADLFENTSASLIAEIINSHALVTANAPPSLVIVLAELKTRQRMTKKSSAQRERLEECVKYLTTTMRQRKMAEQDREFVLKRIRDYVTRRAVFGAIEQAAQDFSEENYDAIVRNITDAAAMGDMVVAPSTGVNIYKSTASKLKRYVTKKTVGRKVPLGIKVLDDAMRGGFEPGKLGFFIAPTGRGKTLSLVHAGAVALTFGLSVAHVTLEIDSIEVEARYDAHFTRVPINALVGNAMTYAKQLDKATRGIKSNLYVKEWGEGEATVRDISAWIDALRTETGRIVDVVLVDYADLLKARGKFTADMNRFAIAEIVRDLRNMARDYDLAVWTASQTGRPAFNSKKVKLQDFAESIEKANKADVVIGLCQTDVERARGLMRLALLKNRLGGKEGLIVDCIVKTETQTLTQSPMQVSQSARAHRR